MKHRFLGCLLLLLALPSRAAENDLDRSIVWRQPAGAGYRETWVDALVGRAMIAATGAEIALHPVAAYQVSHRGGLTVRDLLWNAEADSVGSLSLTGAQIRGVLERAAGDLVQEQDQWPLFHPASLERSIDQFQGLTYELDPSRPPGQRVLHLAFRGESLSAERTLRAAVGAGRAARGDLSPLAGTPASLGDTLAALVRRGGPPPPSFAPSWTILPDYGYAVEALLIQRLVAGGALPLEETRRLYPDDRAQRGDLAYWLARAFGWRASRFSGAYSDLPDSLEPWVDGLSRHRVLDVATRTSETFQPFAPVTLPVALAWCASAARSMRGVPQDEGALRRALLANTSLSRLPLTAPDTLSRAQALGMVANARYLWK